ncbi:transposase [Agromyces sp. NPDC058126]|uniref:transposase n=1 Tax=Agromyces sp. NPDC058126 TaxID=3346350 RepID=UPI0036DBF07A
MGGDALIDEATALYALRPEEFTAARNSRGRELRDDDRELADAVTALHRPAPAAWLVNQLVRHRGDELDELLGLGAELRAAQAELDAPALARLAKQRRALVAALARAAGALADELGAPVRQPVLDEVAQTLTAGMVDASAADAVASGRLVRSLEAVGLEADLDGAVAGGPGGPGGAPPKRPARSKAGRRGDADAGAADREREEQARRDHAERERAAAAAEERSAEASAALDELERELAALTERIAADAARRDELDAELREVEDRLDEHGREQRRLGRERDRAARFAETARDEATAAREALD